MPRVVQSLDAQVDLEGIWDYVAKESPTAAGRLLRRIDQKCRLLASHPEMGQLRNDLAPRLRSFSVGNYVLLFRPIHDGIELVRVIHAARDIDAMF